MIKYILFDLDGTLTDSAPGIMNSFRHTIRHYGLDMQTEEELKRYVGPPLIESFTKYFGFDKEKAVEAVAVYRSYFADKGLFENDVYKGVPKMLKALKDEGYVLAVSTSKPEVYAKRILEYFDLSKHFVTVVGIPLGDESMTKAQVIAQTLDQLEVTDKSEVLMVGDRDYDVKGAAINGIYCLGALYGYGSAYELLSSGARALANTPNDIPDVIKTL